MKKSTNLNMKTLGGAKLAGTMSGVPIYSHPSIPKNELWGVGELEATLKVQSALMLEMHKFLMGFGYVPPNRTFIQKIKFRLKRFFFEVNNRIYYAIESLKGNYDFLD